MRVRLIILLAAASVVASPALADDPLPGPIPAQVERIIDGDTIAVRARIWVGLEMSVHVRLAGVDAPELRGSACPAERSAAQAARDELASLASDTVMLTNVRQGSFAGRVIARVADDGGRDVSAQLLETGLAVSYGDAPPWCEPQLASRNLAD